MTNVFRRVGNSLPTRTLNPNSGHVGNKLPTLLYDRQ
jgi:hypothetical protein